MKSPKQPSPQFSGPQLRKLSEIILEFAGEVAPTFGLSPSPTSVDLVVMIWNCLFLPPEERPEELKKIGDRLGLEGPVLEINLGRLLEIRKKKYRDDRRFIGKFNYVLAGKAPHLEVMSAWVDEGEEPPKL